MLFFQGKECHKEMEATRTGKLSSINKRRCSSMHTHLNAQAATNEIIKIYVGNLSQ